MVAMEFFSWLLGAVHGLQAEGPGGGRAQVFLVWAGRTDGAGGRFLLPL